MEVGGTEKKTDTREYKTSRIWPIWIYNDVATDKMGDKFKGFAGNTWVRIAKSNK